MRWLLRRFSTALRASPGSLLDAKWGRQTCAEPRMTRQASSGSDEHDRTLYELTDLGREALAAWVAESASMPRIQNESAVKLFAADFSDDPTLLASLAGLRTEIARAYERLEETERRAELLPHRIRYLRLLHELARQTLDTQREWLDHGERALGDADQRA